MIILWLKDYTFFQMHIIIVERSLLLIQDGKKSEQLC